METNDTAGRTDPSADQLRPAHPGSGFGRAAVGADGHQRLRGRGGGDVLGERGNQPAKGVEGAGIPGVRAGGRSAAQRLSQCWIYAAGGVVLRRGQHPVPVWPERHDPHSGSHRRHCHHPGGGVGHGVHAGAGTGSNRPDRRLLQGAHPHHGHCHRRLRLGHRCSSAAGGHPALFRPAHHSHQSGAHSIGLLIHRRHGGHRRPGQQRHRCYRRVYEKGGEGS